MTDSVPTREQIQVGSNVDIELKEDQGTGKLTSGMVERILTSSQSHPHGIKVQLKDGKVGRVKILQEDGSEEPDIVKRPSNDGFADLDSIDIPSTEDSSHEFKEFYQYDDSIEKFVHDPSKHKIIEKKKVEVQERFATAICAFGNSRNGGFVYLGIKSDGTISGLSKDMSLGKFADYGDAFANHMRSTLGNFLSNRAFLVSKINIKFRECGDKTICVVQVLPSDEALYVRARNQQIFYTRGFAPRAERLDAKAQVDYIISRFHGKR